jgi:uncharacterized protein YbaA (DUF1428 family)
MAQCVDGHVILVPREASAKAERGRVVFVVVYESRSHRDQVNAKIMSDPRIAKMHAKKPPFDPKRMFYGGFNLIVSM